MTISSTIRTAGPYAGTGIQQVFTFAFKVFVNTDMLVVLTNNATGAVTVQVLTSNYTVSLNADQNNNPGGSITMLAAPAVGLSLSITSQVPLLQPTDIANVGNFYPKAVTDAFDRTCIQIQQQTGLLGSTVRGVIGEQLVNLPPAATRANNVLAFDALGQPTLLVPPSGSGTALAIDLANSSDMTKGVTKVAGAARVVDSMTALRLLPKTGTVRAQLTGYYAPGDGGGGDFYYDPTDTTSADNGGTIIVAGDGGRWKNITNSSGMVSICAFGAVGNANFYNGTTWFQDAGFTIPSTDDSAAIQACCTYCANAFKTAWVPAGRPFWIKTKIVVTRAFSMHGEMPSPSEILSQSPHNKGSVIVSSVVSDYTFEVGLAGTYERGMNWRDFRLFTASASSKGTLTHSMGWDFFFQNVIHEGFLAGGLYLDYIQDGVFLNCGFIACGTNGAQAAITFNRNCNQILFDRLHVEISTYMLDMGSATGQVAFNACHFEVSEYVQAPDSGHPYYQTLPALAAVNRYYNAPPIKIYGGTQDVDFSGCTFGPNTVQGSVINIQGYSPVLPTTFDGGLEQNVPFMILVTAQAISFRGCWFLWTSANYSAKYIDFSTSNDCNVSDCRFDGCWTNGYSIRLSGVKMVNCTLTFNDLSVNYVSPNNKKFYGIFLTGNYCVLDNITFICPNGGNPAKNEGYCFGYVSTGGIPHKLGSTSTGNVSLLSRHHTAAMHAAQCAPHVAVDLAAAAGNLDLEFYNPATLFVFSANNPLSTIVNPAFGQEVKINNKWAGGTVSVANTGTVSLKGGVAAVLPASYGIVTLQENLSGSLIEDGRNF